MKDKNNGRTIIIIIRDRLEHDKNSIKKIKQNFKKNYEIDIE